jgi:hypothetical protein
MLEEEKEYTSSGKIKTPCPALKTQRVLKCWNGIPEIL